MHEPSDRPAYAQRPKAGAAEAAEALLAAVPGISTVSARELLVRFGSVAGVVEASVEELLAVPGIGPERARALDDAFRAGPDGGHPARPHRG
jgi:ERCC4-type nuclease